MFHSLLAIAMLHWLILLTPGPNVLLVSTLAAGGRARSAVFASLGITLVAGIWAALAAAGVHAVFLAHASLRALVQAIGALYLLHVAIRLWRTAPRAPVTPAREPGGWAAFRLGFVTNIGNPKSALFFGSVFATALPHEPGSSMAAAAIAVVVVNALVWHLVLARLLSRHAVQQLYASHARGFSRFAAACVGLFGLRLLADAWRSAREGWS